MTITSTRWVFFIALMLLLPVPFYHGALALLPVFRVIFIITAQAYLYLSGVDPLYLLTDLVLLSAQVMFWGLCLWFIVRAYLFASRRWTASVRGSVMGLLVFSLLIILSSIPVYLSLDAEKPSISFLEVYD